LPHIPSDTGWTHSIYGLCIAAWFVVSRRLLSPKYLFSLFYNSIYGPLMDVLFKSICLIMTTIGTSIICAESVVFNKFDYISPVYNTLKLIRLILPPIQSSPVRCIQSPSPSPIQINLPVVVTYANIFPAKATTVQEGYHFSRLRLLLLQSHSNGNAMSSINSSCIEYCFQSRSMFVSIKSSKVESCSQHHSMISISVYI
jgi:hypothetical protein